MAKMKKVVILLGAIIALGMYPTIDSKAAETTIETESPDLQLSESELMDKYHDMGYDDIKAVYKQQGYSMDDFHSLMMTHPNLKYKYDIFEDELDALYHVIFAEVGNQDYDTIKYTTSVIINRMNSDKFPDVNNIKEVIEAKGQFDVVTTGQYLSVIPDEKTISAVNDVLINGTNTQEDVLFFRSGKYHDLYAQAFQSGDMYFSKI